MGTMLSYKRIGLTVKSDLDHKDEAVQRVLKILEKSGAEVLLDARADQKGAKKLVEEKGVDLLVVIGGDGTILRSVRELKDFSVPLLTVNRGAVGFLAEVRLEEAEELLPKFLKGEGVKDERTLLWIEAKRGKEVLLEGAVLNEAAISQGSIARLVELHTKVNDEELATFRSDGLIIATPTGSTAYSLAAGGPIVHPAQPALILTPINSHSFSQKPLVLPSTSVLTIEVCAKENKFSETEVSLTLDGQMYVKLRRGDVITVREHSQKMIFLRRKQDTFFATLRSKLKWGETL